MLTVWGAKQGFCDGISRRNFLKIGAFGAGLTLAEMLRLRAEGVTATGHPIPQSRHYDLSARRPVAHGHV